MKFYRLSHLAFSAGRAALLTGTSLAALASFGLTPVKAQEVPQDMVFGDMIALTGGNVQLPDGSYAKWQGADNPVIGTDADGSPLMTIKQTQQKALLDWERFSLKTEEILEFQQQAADWIAVNRVHGDQASQINGTIRASGRVFILNDNGVLFGDEATVDVRQLVTGQGVSDVLVDGAAMTIIQKDERAILNWSDMSSQAGEVLRFQQEKSDWIIMNRSLVDGTTSIKGDIEADGHVYIIAPEGLSIAGSIDAQQVIASSLNLTDEQFEAGFDSCIDCNNKRTTAQFSNSWMPNVATNTVTGEQMVEWLTSSGPTAVSEVVVEDSATITTGALGKIMLFGNHVTNEGILSIRDEGQVILAAGENIWLDYDDEDGGRLEAFAGPWDPVAFSGTPYFASQLKTVNSEAEQALWEDLTGTLYPIGYTFSRDEWGSGSRNVGPLPTLLQERIEAKAFAHALEARNTARNSGIIYAERGGNVDFRGLNLEHFGSIEMTSTATFRGKINFDARLYAHNRAWASKTDGLIVPNNGTVTFGEGSLTQITPDLEATDKLPLTEGSQSVGTLDVNAYRLHLQEDSMVYLPSGNMNVWLDESEHITGGRGLGGNMNNETGSRFMMERGATIDLSGWESTVLPMGYHQVTGKLFAAQLADSPLQREGPFYRKEITVDRRYGTDLANWESFDNLTQGTLDQFLVNGGDFFLDGDNDFIMKSGSLIDVSGGKVTYEAGTVTTTLVRRLDGTVIDIREADPDELYMGLANEFTQYDTKWAEQDTYVVPFLSSTSTSYEEGYVEGGNAGNIDILSPDAILQGTVLGGVTIGKYQRQNMPEMGSFTLGNAGVEENEYKTNTLLIAAQEQLISAGFGINDNLEDEFGDFFGEEFDEANYADGVMVGHDEKQNDNATLLAQDFFDRSEMGNYLLVQGLKETDAEGNPAPISVTVEEGVALDLGTAGFTLKSERGGLRFDGSIRTLGGDVALSGASLVLGEDVTIDTSAGWYSEYEYDESRSLLDEVRVHGGNISLGQGNGAGIEEYLDSASLILPESVVLELGGGAWARRDGTVVAGKGGSLSIGSANADVMDMGALYNARALGLGGHGSLSVSTTRGIVIGSELAEIPLLPGQEAIGPVEPIPGVPQPERPEIPRESLLISSDLFAGSGFSAIQLRGERLMVSAGTQVEAAPLTLRLRQPSLNDGLAPWQTAETGTPMSEIVEEVNLSLGFRPDGQRQGMDLSFRTSGTGFIQNSDYPGTILVDSGSRIATEAGGAIRFTASNGAPLAIHGTLQADGGVIDLVSRNEGAEIRIGAEARLLARGAAVTTDVRSSPDGGEWRDGYVLDGGTIQLSNGSDNAIAGQLSDLALTISDGAVLDVSGAQAVFDIQGETGPMGQRVPTTITSDGGTISIAAQLLDIASASYLAQGGGAGASGGHFELKFDAPYEGDGPPPALIVGDPDIPFEFTDETADEPYEGQVLHARLPVESIIDGGFSELALTASPGIVFAGDVNLGGQTADGGYRFDKITLAAPNIIGLDGANVLLEASILDFNLPQSVLNDSPNYNVGLYDLAIGETNIGGENSQAVFTAKSGVLTDITHGAFRGFGDVELFSDGDLRLRGYATDATDDGPLPTQSAFEGVLRTSGDLTLRADQVYAATGRNFLVEAGRTITVLPQEEGQPLNGTPYEAAATLTLRAPRIVQGGIVRSPLGAIVLDAVDDGSEGAGLVRLLPGSVTSVSSDGNIVPYGSLNNGDTWIDPLFLPDPSDPNSRNISNQELRILPERTVTIQGKDVDLAEGALVDLSGGGDLLAGEFTPGVGGTRDWLSGYFDENHDWVDAAGEVYAVMPDYEAGIAPVGLSDAGPEVGERVYLAGGSGLEAGYYTLLPAEYALLPGAFRVTAKHQYDGDYTDVQLGGSRPLNDGSSLQAGYRYVGDLANRDQRTSAFLVMPRETLFARSSYNLQVASGYFGSEAFLEKALRENREIPDAPRTPLDGGSIVLAATKSLNLQASLDTEAGEGGRGGLADIQAEYIAVVGEQTDLAQYDGYLVLDSEQLNELGAESLLLGGVRRQGEVNLELTTGAQDVVVDNQGAVLSGPELIFASLDDISVKEGSSITASGTLSGDANDLRVVAAAPVLIDDQGNTNAADDVVVHDALDYGAVLRLSSGEQIDILRDPDAVDRMESLAGNPDRLAALNEQRAEYGLAPLANGGVLSIADGASIASDTSLTMDATIDTLINEGASISARQISASSSHVSIGEVPEGTAGLVFGGGSLGALAAAEDIVLKSYSAIDFYGESTLRADGTLTLDTRSLRVNGADGGTVTIAGSDLTLANSNGGTGTGTAQAGGATLLLEGDTVYLSGGDKWLSGVEQVNITAQGRVVGQDENTLHVPGALNIDAAAITADSGARQFFDASGAISLTANGNAADLATRPTFGATLGFTGASISNQGELALTGGTISMRAREGDVVLQGGTVDVTSDQVEIFDKLVGVGAGNVSLIADKGDIDVREGARIDVSGGEAGGDAGQLTLTAGLGDIRLDGELDGRASEGNRSGSIRMTSSELGDFAAFNTRLDAGGFRQSRYFEINQGDVTIDSDVAVQQFTVVANDGSITLSGTVETPGEDGGRVQLSAARDVTLTGSARLLARANAEDGAGGTVFLETVGANGGTIDIAAGSLIDVSGSGEGGRTVRLRAPQIGGNDVAIDRIDGTITGARSVVAEAFRVYDDVATIDQDVIDLVSGDAADFMMNAPAINARLGEQVQLAPGIELRSDGDMELVTDWDTSTMRYDGAAGVLTLRAQGDLLINANLSDGFDGTAADAVLLGGTSWAFNLTGGANIASPNSLAVLPQGQLAEGKGSVIIGGTADTIEYYQTSEDLPEPNKPQPVQPPEWFDWVLSGEITFDEFNRLINELNASFDADWNRYLSGEISADELRAAWPTTTAGLDLELPIAPHYGIENRLYLLDEDGNFVRDPQADGPLPFVELDRDRVTGKYVDPFTGELISHDPETGDYADTGNYARRALPWAVSTNGYMPSQDLSGERRFASYDDLLSDTAGYIQSDNSTGYLVRTGTSGINVASGRDFVLQQAASVLYTAGEQAPDVADFSPVPGSYIPVNGGDISIHVGGAIKGAASRQLPGAWLRREGSVGRYTGVFGPGNGREHDQFTWYIDFARYRAGVGALGGGNIDISAQGDINDFTVNIPTTGRVAGGYDDVLETTFYQTGGGDLTMRAGGNIRGGVYYVGDGLGEITAGGAFTATPGAVWWVDPFRSGGVSIYDRDSFSVRTDLNPLFFTSGGELHLQSGGDLNIEAVLDPLISTIKQNDAPFMSYTPDATVSLFSAGGDIRVWNNSFNIRYYNAFNDAALNHATFIQGVSSGSTSGSFGNADLGLDLELWPATLQATAAAGDVHLIGGLIMAPSPTGNVELVARRNVQIGAADDPHTQYIDTLFGTVSRDAFSRNFLSRNTGLAMGQALPELLATPDNPLVYGFDLSREAILHAGLGTGYVGGQNGVAYFTAENAPVLHVGDHVPALIYAGEGKAVLSDSVTLPKALRVRAGTQIYFPQLTLQHNNADDLTLLKAGEGIYLAGNTSRADASYITVSGPGRLDIETGGDLWIPDNDLGITTDKISVSLLDNRMESPEYLYPDRDAADISITVGLEQEPDYAGFAEWLFSPDGADTPDYALIDAGDGRELSMYLFDRLNPRAGRGTDPVLFDADLRAGFVNYIRGLQGLEALENEADQGLYLGEAWDYWQGLPSGQQTPFDHFFPRGEAAASVDPTFYLPETSEGLVNYVRRANGMEVLETQEEQLAFLDEAWTLWDAMPIEAKTPFYRAALNMELRTTGREANDPDSDRYNATARGYDAIARLFPGAQRRADEDLTEGEARWSGNFETFASRVLSRGGGDIDIVVPGGELMLANIAATNAQTGQPTDEFGGSEQGDALRSGLITENGGAINIFTHDSVTVNQSRILTAKGGSILTWSSYGDIAAGAGAKTSISPTYYDYTDNSWYDRNREPAGLPTGAGIGTLASVNGAPAADVDLIAPNGIIDAGDAGIRVSGNFNVFAVQILGTDNIDVSGIATGLPVPPAAPPTSLDTGDVAAQANRAIEAITDAMAQAQDNASVTAPSIIEVQVTGYGCPPEDLTCDNPSTSRAPAAEAGSEQLVMAQAATTPAPIDRVHTLSIPPQPLKQAIDEVSRKTGTDVIYDSDIPVAGATQGVQGKMTAEEALRLMVKELGLEPVKVNPQSIVLRHRS